MIFGEMHVTPFANESWYEYSYYEDYMPEGERCDGHGEHDPALPLLVGLDELYQHGYDSDADGVLSNGEFYEAIHPVRGFRDYIYDNLEWSHCRSGEGGFVADDATVPADWTGDDGRGGQWTRDLEDVTRVGASASDDLLGPVQSGKSEGELKAPIEWPLKSRPYSR